MKLHNTYKLIFAGFMLFSVLACNASFIALNSAPTSTPPIPVPLSSATSVALISQQVTLTTEPFNESNPGGNFPPYTITSRTPQLTGSDDPRVQAFNQWLKELVSKEVDTFRQSFQQLPVTSLSNGSSLDAKYTLVSQTGDLWSFKFDFSFYSDTAAHPGLNSVTVNYDLGQGRELTLGDLFLPSSNYLEVISNYCIAELKKQPYADSFFLDGAKATSENYRNWNITPDGLLITFDEYQVAPYAAGPQMVLVPYSELQVVMDPQGALGKIGR